LLVLGGAGPDASYRALPSEGAAFDVRRIASILASVNPSLSAEEQQRIGRAVITSSRRHALDPELVTAVLLVESSARPWARSDKGAVGLMQVMPHMVAPRALAGNLTTIESNVEAGCIILADNIRRLGEEDGISAYFWGSNIRGVAYLDRVQQARARVRRFSES
jgi:soluble lytic murein transglycosylase-like protein